MENSKFFKEPFHSKIFLLFNLLIHLSVAYFGFKGCKDHGRIFDAKNATAFCQPALHCSSHGDERPGGKVSCQFPRARSLHFSGRPSSKTWRRLTKQSGMYFSCISQISFNPPQEKAPFLCSTQSLYPGKVRHPQRDRLDGPLKTLQLVLNFVMNHLQLIWDLPLNGVGLNLAASGAAVLTMNLPNAGPVILPETDQVMKSGDGK